MNIQRIRCCLLTLFFFLLSRCCLQIYDYAQHLCSKLRCDIENDANEYFTKKTITIAIFTGKTTLYPTGCRCGNIIYFDVVKN